MGSRGSLSASALLPAVSAWSHAPLLLLEQGSCCTSVCHLFSRWLWSESLHATLQAEPGSLSSGGRVCPESRGVQHAHCANVTQWLWTENQCSLEVSRGLGQWKHFQHHLTTCIVVFLRVPLAPSIPGGLPLSRRM